MSRLHQILLRPVRGEKASLGLELYNKVTFKVDRKATKPQIRQAVEELLGVRVVKVNTANMPGKPKRRGRQMTRRPGYKKAVITLAAGEELSLLGPDQAQDEVNEDEFGPEAFAEDAMES